MQTNQQSLKIKKWLYPIAFIYGLVVRFRNKLFDWGILKQKEFPIPIICVGNVTVGGTGKTPHTEYLIEILKEQYNVAVLSRGYKRKTKGFIIADSNSTAETIGDEPYQIKSKFPDIVVAVEANRRHGIEKLLMLTEPKIDVIILDDAYQHRYVKAGLNIMLADSTRPICEDKLLPAGRLREPALGKYRAQIVIVTKCKEDIKPIDFNIYTKKLALYPFQKLYFSSFSYKQLQPVFLDNAKIELNSLSDFDHILLVTGIANTTPLIQKIKQYNNSIINIAYKDHHSFSKKDMEEISKRFKELEGNNIIITTEKDATRFLVNTHVNEVVKENLYYLPIKVNILQNRADIFHKNIQDYVRENKRDR